MKFSFRIFKRRTRTTAGSVPALVANPPTDWPAEHPQAPAGLVLSLRIIVSADGSTRFLEPPVRITPESTITTILLDVLEFFILAPEELARITFIHGGISFFPGKETEGLRVFGFYDIQEFRAVVRALKSAGVKKARLTLTVGAPEELLVVKRWRPVSMQLVAMKTAGIRDAGYQRQEPKQGKRRRSSSFRI
jgi:hypothetical protein